MLIMAVILYYDIKQGLQHPDVAEARDIAEHLFGKENVRLEGFDYQPFACASDKAREGGQLSLNSCCGRLRGIDQIRLFSPLKKEVRRSA